jgi:hypothetical protein
VTIQYKLIYSSTLSNAYQIITSGVESEELCCAASTLNAEKVLCSEWVSCTRHYPIMWALVTRRTAAMSVIFKERSVCFVICVITLWTLHIYIVVIGRKWSVLAQFYTSCSKIIDNEDFMAKEDIPSKVNIFKNKFDMAVLQSHRLRQFSLLKICIIISSWKISSRSCHRCIFYLLSCIF